MVEPQRGCIMQPWDMGERPTPPDEQLPPWYERLAPYAAGAAVLIAIYLVLVLIEQSGVGLAFVLFLGALLALSTGAVWLLITVLDWLGVPLVLRVREVTTRTVFALGVLALLVLGALGKFAPPERPQILETQGPLPDVPVDERVLMLLVVPLVAALMLGIMSWTGGRRQWPFLALVAGIMLAIGTGRVWLAIVLFVVLVLALWRPLSRLRRG